MTDEEKEVMIYQASGMVVRLNEKRYETLRSDSWNQALFEEPVDDFKVDKKRLPLLVFIFGPGNRMIGVGLGRKGDSAGTGMRLLTIRDIICTEKFQILAEDIYFSQRSTFDSRIHETIKDRLTNGGLLTPKAFKEFVCTISSLHEHLKKALDELITYTENLDESIRKLDGKAQALSNQRDGFAMALYGSGHDPKLLSHWHTRHHPAYMTKGTGSYFNGLNPHLFKPLDKEELYSLFHIPGFELMLNVPGATTIIYRRKNPHLVATMACRQPLLEEQAGANLIYYDEGYNTFVIVHCEAEVIRSSNNYRFQYELRDMERLYDQISSFSFEVLNDANSFKLNKNPFFLRFISAKEPNLEGEGLSRGMNFPIEHWRLYEKSSDPNLERYFNNTLFTDLMSKSWIGSPIKKREILEEWLNKVLDAGRSVTFAIKRKGNTDKENEDQTDDSGAETTKRPHSF